MIRKHFRLRRRIFIGLAFASLVAAPAAQATTGFYVDGGPAPRSDATISVSSTPIASEISVQATPSALELEGQAWLSAVNVYENSVQPRSENSFGAPGPSVAGATGPSTVGMTSATTSSGFDWSDAGIGASIAFAAALLLGISLVLGRRNRDRTGLASA